jgi:hypothetical protein
MLFAGCILQIYLIARYVFGSGDRDTHAFGGFILMFIALLSLIVALIIRANKWNVILSLAVLLLLYPVQGLLAYSDIDGAFRALHGVNGILIMGLSYILANGFAKAVVPEKVAGDINKVAQTAAAAD